jgi:hypothetical protein
MLLDMHLLKLVRYHFLFIQIDPEQYSLDLDGFSSYLDLVVMYIR